MRRIKRMLQSVGATLVAACLIAAGLPAAVWAGAVDEPSLVISQLKITSSNGQFIRLYNATDAALDMSQYRLEYLNNYDLAKVTSSRQISLSGILPPHSYYLVNDDLLTLCYRLMVDSASLGLSSTAGRLELATLDNPDNPQDYVSWSKKAAVGAQTLPVDTSASLLRQPVDGSGNPAITEPGGGDWQAVKPDPDNACGFISAAGGSGPITTGLTQLLPASQPPATILSIDTDIATEPAGLPAADIGLKAPVITELLPNPEGTGNDATDEFVELYNSNDTAFDLSGFSLQTGTTSLHTYRFSAGSSLPPHGFMAFYSSATGLSLGNNGGQARLLDPFGNSLSVTATYGTAKDGQAWALANDKWYWTTKPTPGAANVINQPPVKKKTAQAGSSKNKASAVSAKAKNSKSRAAASSDNRAADEQASDSPIHFRSLALVGTGAILYGAYEYREDIKNRIYELRGYLRTRREGRA